MRNTSNMQIQICNNLPDPALFIDPRTCLVTNVNSAYVKKFRASRKDVIGKKCYEVIHRRTARCNGGSQPCIISKVLRVKKIVSEDHIHYGRNNKPCEVKVTASLLRGVPGGDTVFVIIRPTYFSAGAGAAERDNKKYISELKNLVFKDHLTGVYNNYYFLDRLRSEVSRSKRYGFPLSLAKIDIDYFASINETYGRKAGDRLLVGFASFLKHLLRESDVLSRCGGEEFSIIMTHTDKIGAALAANRMISRLNEQTFKTEGAAIKLKVSIGVVSLSADPSCDDPDKLLSAVDKALERAKGSGGN
ncbi:MAG: GGDEF domain-containing protein, partial [Candidatus Omnitrophica bacterium]|nr:GGDEF domain-containing protein [Candidatus Omnitrophota bacterium]